MSVNLYQTLKMLHVLGSILFVGNIMVTAVWKLKADRTGNPAVVAFSQRLVTLTDVVFTGCGAGIVLVTGLVMSTAFEMAFWKIRWLAWGMGLFIASGLIWAGILIPIQIKQSHLTRSFANGAHIPPEYRRLQRLWMAFGSLATILPLCNIYFMVFKPT